MDLKKQLVGPDDVFESKRRRDNEVGVVKVGEELQGALAHHHSQLEIVVRVAVKGGLVVVCGGGWFVCGSGRFVFVVLVGFVLSSM